jgi:uncharacterized membrane protein YbhN (UPF0104 family)
MELIRRYARPALVAVLVGACVWALIASWDDITDVVPRIGAARYVLATLAAIAAGIGLAYGWRVLLADIAGEKPPDRIGHVESVAVFSASQLGKYVPGSVWPVVAQMSLARRHGIARRHIVAAFVTHLLLLIVVAVVLAAATLPWVDAAQLRTRWWLLVLAPLICLTLVPSLQRRLLAIAGRLLGRDLPVALPHHTATLRAGVISLATYACFGLHLAVLAWPLSAEPDGRVLVQSAGAFALAWAAGFVVVFAPAGLGVREVVLTVTMGSVLTAPDATALAVLSRTSIVIADLVLGLVGIGVVGARPLRRGVLAAAQHDEHVGGGPSLSRLDVGDEPEDQHLGGEEQADRRPDEARHPARLAVEQAEDEPAHDQHDADHAGDR